MKFLTMETEGSGFRSKAIGWSYQDNEEASFLDFPPTHENIGRIREWNRHREPYPNYEAPLYALGDGWRLLAPPTTLEDGGREWFWFTKE